MLLSKIRLFWIAVPSGGRTQRKAAAILWAKTGAAISGQLKKLRRRLSTDVALYSRVDKIEKMLQRS